MENTDKEILETFRKVEVNIPLLDAIKQIPRYAKFLKHLCTHKRRLKGNKKVNVEGIFLLSLQMQRPGNFHHSLHNRQ